MYNDVRQAAEVHRQVGHSSDVAAYRRIVMFMPIVSLDIFYLENAGEEVYQEVPKTRASYG